MKRTSLCILLIVLGNVLDTDKGGWSISHVNVHINVLSAG